MLITITTEQNYANNQTKFINIYEFYEVVLKMCDKSDTDEDICTPPEITEIANTATLNLLPEKSRKQYEIAYNRFREWCADKKAVHFTENVLLAYFSERSTKVKPSSLWSEYSMVRASLSVKHDVDIKTYTRVMAFLKRNSVGFRAKKSKIFNRDQIYKFLKEAPDLQYLMKKVLKILILFYFINVFITHCRSSQFLVLLGHVGETNFKKWVLTT